LIAIELRFWAITGTLCLLVRWRKHLFGQIVTLGVQFLAMRAVLSGLSLALSLVDGCLLLG
jgi:hypothetical protein